MIPPQQLIQGIFIHTKTCKQNFLQFKFSSLIRSHIVLYFVLLSFKKVHKLVMKYT